jgi:hypothetical protein
LAAWEIAMLAALPAKLEAGRLDGDPAWGGYGRFSLMGPCGENLLVVASGADAGDVLAAGWEHVSVSTRRRCPNWVEMCFVKDLFWGEDEVVIQIHPRRSRYINNHPFCLHLWKRRGVEFALPPEVLVGNVDGTVRRP